MGTLRGFLAVNKRKILASAQRHLQRGSLEKALKDYLRLLDVDPRDANVRLKVGDLQLRRNQPREAIDAYLKVADQFMRDGFDAKAVAIYKQVTKIDGKRYEVYLPLAELYQRLGLVSEAMAALQCAADGYQQEGKRRDALELLRKMSSLDPANVPSRLKVADLLAKEELTEDALNEYDAIVAEAERQGDWETQIAVFERIVEVDPARIASAQNFTHLLLERNQSEQAEHVARKCVEADPERAESNELLAEVLTALGKSEEAVSFFRRAAAAWRDLGDEAKARDLVQRHVSADDIDFGAADLRNDEGPDAAPTSAFVETPLETAGFEEAPTRGIGDLADPNVVMDLGFDADSSSESASAEELPELVPEPIEEDATPIDAEQLLAEASVYVRYGKHEKAIEAVQAVLDQEPANVVALEQLGDALAAAGHDVPAVDAWVKAGKLLSSESDAEKIESLRSRIGARSEQAAAEVAAPHAPPSDAAAPVESEPPRKAAPASAKAPEEDPEEIELELVETPEPIEAPGASALAEAPDVSPPVQAASATAPEDDLEIEVDVDALDGLSDLGGEPAEPSGESPNAASTSTSAQIADELAEADSLVDRGRLDEAQALYQRILEVAPNHPAAQLRIGEIQDARLQAEKARAAETPPDLGEGAEPGTRPAPRLESASSSEEPSVDFEDDIDLDAALAEAAEAVDRASSEVAEVEEARESSAPLGDADAPLEEGDEAPVAIEFAPGEDPEVSFAGLEAGVEELDSEALGEVDEEPLEFDDEAALDAGEAEPTPAMEREPPQAEGATPELPRATEVALEADALAEPPQPVEEERLLESASRTNVETPAEVVAVVETRSRRTPPSPQAAPLRAEVAAVVEDATDLVAPTEDVAEVPAVVAAAEDPLAGVITLEAGAFDPDESFDLAAELSDVLSEDAGATASAIAKEEQTGSLETLFSEFKRGVERTLGAGDVETHFDLGIAYREMGLFDDAIGEFQHALGSENRRLDALHLMALCALELGRPADATAHLEQALSSAEWPEDREAPLRFDLAHAYVAVGDADRALDAFRRVAEIDPSFGDVGAQIAALENERGGADGEGAAQETYESFDDLIDATAEPDTSADEGMENFEEFQDFDADADAEEPEEAVDPDPAENRPSVRRRRKVSFI